VPEFGREYSIGKFGRGDDTWSTHEFVAIAAEQARREDLAARECDRVVVCDTDAFTTAIWAERYLGRRVAEVDAIAAEGRPHL